MSGSFEKGPRARAMFLIVTWADILVARNLFEKLKKDDMLSIFPKLWWSYDDFLHKNIVNSF